MISFNEGCYSLRLTFSIGIFFLQFFSNFNKIENVRLSSHLGPFGEAINSDPEFRKKVNVSQTEYATKIVDFYTVERFSRNLTVLNKVSSEIHQPGIIVTFQPHGFDDVEISTAEVKMLIPPANNIKSLELFIRVVDLTGDPERSYITSKVNIHLSEDKPKWVEFRLTDAVKKWVENGALEWKLLFEGLYVKPKEAYLNVVVKPTSEHKRQKRSGGRHWDVIDGHNFNRQYNGFLLEPEEDYEYWEQNEGSMRCNFETAQYHRTGEINCCRLQIKLYLDELKRYNDIQNQLWHIFAPDEIIFSLCQGNCPTFLDSVTKNHTMFHHALLPFRSRLQELCPDGPKITTLIQDVPNLCCAPTRYKNIYILRQDFNNPTLLQKLHIPQAIITNCECV